MLNRSKRVPADTPERHNKRLRAIEASTGPIYAMPSHYPAGDFVEWHSHSRPQLLYARTGVVMVTSTQGRWMVPPEHALWIPAGIEHSVDILGEVNMLSVYVAQDALPAFPNVARVVAITDLARALIVEAAAPRPDGASTGRIDLIMPLLLDVISTLPDRSLGLPFPEEPRLAALCSRFLAKPSPHLVIDDWARELSMSRRTFTRAFHRETGLSLSIWRQQACLFAALPRLAGGEPVTSVALDLGYESIAAFTTMFKRMLGVAPRAYFGGRASAQ
ncbi:AraC family transcriptional regulator [Rhizobium tubonense]|nr:helix-turn-helix transcriptional regulator [Rhizobium tubonense]